MKCNIPHLRYNLIMITPTRMSVLHVPVEKNPQKKSSKPNSKNSSMLNPSRNSAKNAINVSQNVIGSSFGRHLQIHPFPKSGRCTCKPSVTSPPQPKIQRTPFGQLPRLRRSRTSLVPFPYKPIPKVSKVCRPEWRSHSSLFPVSNPIEVRGTFPNLKKPPSILNACRGYKWYLER
jgi:hypothetical protein